MALASLGSMDFQMCSGTMGIQSPSMFAFGWLQMICTV